MQKALCIVLIAVLVFPLVLRAAETGDVGRSYFDFGVFAYEEQDYSQAAVYFQKALDMAPANALYRYWMGKTYLKTERLDLAGEYLKTAWKTDPDILGLDYDLAMWHFKSENYAEAAQRFSRIADRSPERVLAQYHAGLSHMKAQNYAQAPPYFLAAAQASPSLSAKGFYSAGICYQKSEQPEKARQMFEKVKKQSDSELAQSAEQWLGAIKKSQDRRPFSLYLKAGRRYDDNVPLDPLDRDLYTEESDWLSLLYFSGAYRFDPGAYQLGLGFNQYNTWYDDLDEYNLAGSTLRLFGRYRFAPFSLGFSYLPTYYWLDGESYLRRHQLRPELIWQSRQAAIRLSYTYSDDNYFEQENRDGEEHEAGLEGVVELGATGIHLLGGFRYADYNAKIDFEDYSQWRAKLGLSMALFADIQLNLTGRYQVRDYDGVWADYGVKREDDRYSGTLSLSRHIYYQWLGGILEFSHTQNDSNINDYEYERTTASFALTLRY